MPSGGGIHTIKLGMTVHETGATPGLGDAAPPTPEDLSQLAKSLLRVLKAPGETVPNVTPTDRDEEKNKANMDEFAEFDTD